MRRLSVCRSAVPAVAVSLAMSVAAGVALSAPPRVPAVTQRGLAQIVAGGVPGTFALVRDPGGTATASAGVARLGASGPLRAETPFRVGSVTKAFVAALILQLADEHRLRLADTVGRWLPGVLASNETITVEQLLRHTSGMADDEGVLDPLLRDPTHAFLPLTVARAAAQAPRQFEAGRGWGYANANYVLLGLIAERVTGQPLARLLRERIVEPLGLRHTWLPVDEALPTGAARGYLPVRNTVTSATGDRPLDVTGTSPSWTWAAGALVSTAGDLSRFVHALLSGEVVPRRLLGRMLTSRPTGAGTGYGLGLLRVDTACGPAFGHDGEIFGYTTLALERADGRRGIILLANASHPGGGASILAAFLALARHGLCVDGRSSR